MKENVNYQLKMDKILKEIKDGGSELAKVPSLLLHSCCAKRRWTFYILLPGTMALIYIVVQVYSA